jgi:hypothetical protein
MHAPKFDKRNSRNGVVNLSLIDKSYEIEKIYRHRILHLSQIG